MILDVEHRNDEKRKHESALSVINQTDLRTKNKNQDRPDKFSLPLH